MLTALTQSVTVMGISLALIISNHQTAFGDVLQTDPTTNKIRIFLCELPNNGLVESVWSTILYCTFAITLIANLLLLHLCGFHIFLSMFRCKCAANKASFLF